MLDYRSLFDQAHAPMLVLRPDAPVFHILSANESYHRATLKAREGPGSIIGRGIFEAFPDPPDDPNATGTRNLRLSLQAVLSTKRPHRMAVQRYDIETPYHSWEERYWEPLNTPVLGENGRIEYILHAVQDVTDRERHRQTAAVEHSAREAAEDANLAKMQFLAAMSHESGRR